MEKKIWFYFSTGTVIEPLLLNEEFWVLKMWHLQKLNKWLSVFHTEKEANPPWLCNRLLSKNTNVCTEEGPETAHPFNLVCFRASTWSYNPTLSYTSQCILLSMTGRQALVFKWHLKSQLHLNPKAHKAVRTCHDCFCQTEPFICMGSLHYLWQIAIGKDTVLSCSLD